MEFIWFDIDLETVEPYDIWKPESLAWAATVNWATVNDLVRNNVENYPTDDLDVATASARAAGLSETDLWGLGSLYQEPIFATPQQISSGGHRITAMRSQGVRWALGQCLPDDIGPSVDPLHAYPPRRGDGGNRRA